MKMIALFYCINPQNPRRNTIDSHISSIFAEKETNKIQMTKLKLKLKTKRSLNQNKYIQRREKTKNEIIPQTIKQMFIVLCIENFTSYQPLG